MLWIINGIFGSTNGYSSKLEENIISNRSLYFDIHRNVEYSARQRGQYAAWMRSIEKCLIILPSGNKGQRIGNILARFNEIRIWELSQLEIIGIISLHNTEYYPRTYTVQSVFGHFEPASITATKLKDEWNREKKTRNRQEQKMRRWSGHVLSCSTINCRQTCIFRLMKQEWRETKQKKRVYNEHNKENCTE